MTARVRNRLLALGIPWGLLLASLPALMMTSPYQLTGLLLAALVCAALSGAVGTLAAGRRALRGAAPSEGLKRSKVLAGVRVGASQGLVGGGVAALLFWMLMAVTASGFTLQNPVEISVFMSPRVFMGSFFVALSVFLYAFLASLLLGPIFGTLVKRVVCGNRAAADNTGGEESLVVR